jgi:hypothetical protein
LLRMTSVHCPQQRTSHGCRHFTILDRRNGVHDVVTAGCPAKSKQMVMQQLTAARGSHPRCGFARSG